MSNEVETRTHVKRDCHGRFLAILCTVLLAFAGVPSIAIGEDAEEPAVIETEKSLDEEALKKKAPAPEEEAKEASNTATEIETPAESPANKTDDEASVEADVCSKELINENDSVESLSEEALNAESATMAATPYAAYTHIALSPSYRSMYPGETFTIRVEFVGMSGSFSPSSVRIQWGSDNTRVATVSTENYSPNYFMATVTAESAGSTHITARTLDGTNLSASCQISVANVYASSLTVSPNHATLKPGETQSLTPTIYPNNTTDKSVAWSSGDSRIASVDSDGLVTAKAVGTAVITARTQDGTNCSSICTITVTPITAESLTLSSTSETLKISEKVKLVATVNPANTANKNVTWKSSDDGIATVASDGTVTAKSVGTATITATTADGSKKTAECEVTVEPIISESVSVSPTEVTLRPSEMKHLTATVSPADATNKSVEWRSSDDGIISVAENGTIAARTVGTAIVTATTLDGSNKTAECKVTVEPVLVTDISLSSTDETLKMGDSVTLTSTVLPGNATNKKMFWNSADPAVATVAAIIEDRYDYSGTSISARVVAKSVGTTIITATAADGSGETAACTITVEPIEVTDIKLSSTAETLNPGKTVKLTAEVSPGNATNKNITWGTSDAKVATVDPDGLVTAQGVGIAQVAAMTSDGSNISAICTITVEAVTATEISVSVTTCSLKVGESVEVGASLEPPDVTDRGVTWATSDEKVVTVKPMDATARSVAATSAIVTAVGPGKATVMAVPDDGSPISAVCEIEVAEQPAAPDPGTGSTTDSTPGASSDSDSGSSSPTTVETSHVFAASTDEPKAPEQEAAEPEGQRLVWTAGTPTKTTEAIPLVRTGDALFLVGASAFVLIVAATVIIVRRRPA